MASLKFIMEDADHAGVHTHGTIRDPGSFATPFSSRAPDSSGHQGPGQDHDTHNNNNNNNNNNIDTRHNINNCDTNTGYPPRPSSTAPFTTKPASDATVSGTDPSPLSGTRRAGSLEGAPGSPGATSSSSRPAYSHHRRTTSTDSMDRHSYPPPPLMEAGGRGASAGRGGAGRQRGIGGGMGQMNQPMRPMPPHVPAGSPIRLTPITRRISRAKKGQPVHTCEICRPSKTFTRAEHLRRHQLSHQTPGFPCEWPGCERAFHRHDLLTRHQQKHEQEGDGASSTAGVDQSMSGPSASTIKGVPLAHGLLPSSGSASGGVGTSTPHSCDVPSTPSMTNVRLQPMSSSPGDVTISTSPHNMSRGRRDRPPSSRQSQDSYGGYTLSSSAATNPAALYTTTSTTLDSPNLLTPTASSINYRRPRSELAIVTVGLPGQSVHIPDGGKIPDLIPTTDVSLESPWGSSSDSAYSTPLEARGSHQAAWVQKPGSPPRNDWHSPYPATSAHDTLSMEAIAAPFMHFPQSPHPPLMSPHSYPMHQEGQSHQYGIIGMTMGSSFSNTEVPPQGLHQVLGVNDGTSTVMNHGSVVDPRNSISLSSVGSTSPIAAPAHRTESLITPSTSLPADRVRMMTGLGRHKEVMVTDASGMGMAVSMAGGVSLIGSVPYGLSGGSGNPGLGGGGFLPSQGLAGMGGCVSGPILASPLPKNIRNMIPTYLDTYWRHHGAYYPLVHYRMAEDSSNDVLRCAMAAVGAQLLDDKDDRNKGMVLHEHVVQELKVIAQWDLPTMQAIILCEYFFRFRGKKAATRPSKRFESLYSRSMAMPSTSGGPASATSAMEHECLDQSQAINRLESLFEQAPTAQSSPHLTRDQRWRAWLNSEAHRRLLNACFTLDVHTSIYHEHNRCREFNLSGPGRVPPIPLVGRSRELWNAQSAEEWDAILNEDPGAGVPLFIPHPDQLAPMIPEQGSTIGCQGIPLNPFDRLAILSFEASRLPRRTVPGASPSSSSDGGSPTPIADGRQAEGSWNLLGGSSAGSFGIDPVAGVSPALASMDVEARISHLFPGCPVANAYLAINHTPLHDLLAVCGHGSMASQKSPANSKYLNNQKRIRLWVEQGQASPASPSGLDKSLVKATIYAARALLGFLGQDSSLDMGGESSETIVCKLSDYWATYVCALICWSSGHRLARGGEQLGSNIPTSHGEALEWLRLAAQAQPGDAGAWAHIWSSRGAIGIVSLVRCRLEPETVGTKSQPSLDAVDVLRRIEECANWRWF